MVRKVFAVAVTVVVSVSISVLSVLIRGKKAVAVSAAAQKRVVTTALAGVCYWLDDALYGR